MKKAIEIDPDYTAAQLLLGKTLIRTGNVHSGQKKLEQVVKSDPEGNLGKEAEGEMAKLKHSKFKGIAKP